MEIETKCELEGRKFEVSKKFFPPLRFFSIFFDKCVCRHVLFEYFVIFHHFSRLPSFPRSTIECSSPKSMKLKREKLEKSLKSPSKRNFSKHSMENQPWKLVKLLVKYLLIVLCVGSHFKILFVYAYIQVKELSQTINWLKEECQKRRIIDTKRISYSMRTEKHFLGRKLKAPRYK